MVYIWNSFGINQESKREKKKTRTETIHEKKKKTILTDIKTTSSKDLEIT